MADSQHALTKREPIPCYETTCYICYKERRADPTKIRGEQICGGVVIYSGIVL